MSELEKVQPGMSSLKQSETERSAKDEDQLARRYDIMVTTLVITLIYSFC